MPDSLNLRWIAALAAAIALLALPAAAQATLTYIKFPLHSSVYAAADNGSGAHKVGGGSNPRVSPDGKQIAYLHEGPGHAQELKLAAASGGASRTLMVGWRSSFYLVFSPDSKTIAALRGPEIGKLKLVLVDIATGAQRTVAAGYFSGFSFSPDGSELAYAKAGSETSPFRSDIYRVATAGGKSSRLTRDHNSQDPTWGPTDRIVFVKQLGAKNRQYGPKNELFLMNSDGTHVKRLTHTKVDPLLVGLYPTEWSASGKQLLAEFEGQDTSYAVTVNPKTGAQHALDKSNQGETGFVGSAISKDGTTVLGYTGGFDPGSAHDVATIPYGGGKAKVLVKNAFEPDWSR
jgi:Tol biopolymer transport system component